MKDLEKELCKVMHKFVKEHIDEIPPRFNYWGVNKTFEELGFESCTDMLKGIKRNITDATWALTELCDWGMREHSEGHNYRKEIFLFDTYEDSEGYEICVYKIKDSDNKERFFTINYETMTPCEVEKKAKVIEVFSWHVKES